MLLYKLVQSSPQSHKYYQILWNTVKILFAETEILKIHYQLGLLDYGKNHYHDYFGQY